jgi:hypothetical protein
MNCDGNEIIDLKQVFIKLSINLENKNFGTFSLNNTAVFEIPENVFGNITFQSIEIKNAYNLSLIHKNAFNNSNDNLLGFSISSTPLRTLKPLYDIWTAMSPIKNLRTLYIENTLIKEIADNAFGLSSDSHYNLSYIFIFNNHMLNRIGDNAFGFLPSLTKLDLTNNSINHISKNAFNSNIKPTASQSIYIDLSDNYLTGASFEVGAFSDLNIQTELRLGIWTWDKNNITYLDKHVFKPFLDKTFSGQEVNAIDMSSILSCNDSRNQWLFENKKYEVQVSNLFCLNHK